MNDNIPNNSSRISLKPTSCLLLAINLPALKTIYGPSWISQGSASLEKLFMICLFLVNAVIIYIAAALKFRFLRIAKQTAKNSIPLLILILELLLFGVPLMMTSFISSQQQFHWFFLYQTTIAILAILILVTSVIYIVLNLKKDTIWSLSDQVLLFTTCSPLTVSVFRGISQSSQLPLTEEAMNWSKISSVVICLAFVMLLLYMNMSRETILRPLCEEIYKLVYFSAALCSFYRGIRLIINHYEDLREQNQLLEQIIFRLWIIFLTVVPVPLDTVAWLGDLLLEDGFKFPSLFSDAQNQAQASANNQQEVDSNDGWFGSEALNEELRSVQIEEAKEKGCPICWEEFSADEKIVSRIACSHCFHESCLKTWIWRDPRCPLCRGRFQAHELVF